MEAVSDVLAGLDGGPIRIRVGIHTGEPGLDPPKYVGIDVHRAARLMSAGHGGQVLLSQSTRERVEAEVTDLGEHRFKDLAAPERVFQLGEAHFPPIRSLYRANLPVPATPFLGREPELAAVAAMLGDAGARLVSLVGPGGTGKTRLALQAAAEASDDYPDGVWWVPLAPVRDPALVLSVVATAVGAAETAGGSAVDDLAEALAGRRLLVFVDNVEHLMPAAADAIGSFVAACPSVKAVVTSRERLRVTGERVYAVPPMSETDGEALFRSRAADGGVELGLSDELRTLCARLDNLPLALELAAARTGVFSPAQLLDRLAQRLDLFKADRGVDARQMTLRATIAWSHDLLDSGEQALFRRLSVFPGGCTLAAAEQVAGADIDTLQSLLDKSLLRRRVVDDEPRFWMLETIREFAAEQLAGTAEHDAVHAAHAAAFRDLAEQAKIGLAGDDVLAWLARLDADLDNVRAALAWAKLLRDGETLLGIATCMSQYLQTRGHLAEARQWLSEALDDELETPAPIRATALLSASHLALRLGDLEAAERLCRCNIALCEETGDAPRLSQSLSVLAVAWEYRGDGAEAARYHDRALALARETGDQRALRMTLNYVALFELTRANYDRARELFEEGYTLAGVIGWRSTIAGSLYDLCLVDALAGQHDDVRRRLPEVITIYRELEDRETMAYAFILLAAADSEGGRPERAATLLGASESMLAEVGAKVEPLEQQLVDRALAGSREQLEPEAWERAHASGWELGFDKAAELALSDCLA